MKIKHKLNQKLLLLLLFLNFLNFGKGFAQITGSLFMLPNNFYAQMYNPSYMRTDNAIEVSIFGVGGFSFVNQGSFKFSELITTTPDGNAVLDFDNFYNYVKPNNFVRQDFSIPMAFLSLPLKDGIFSFYYKENFSSVLKFEDDLVEFLVNGNLAPDYRSFNSGEINLLSIGYREFAFGYAKSLDSRFDIGLRAKILFGAAFLNADEWNFGIETAPGGELITLTAEGGGELVLPVPVTLRADSSIYIVDSNHAFQKYLGAYQNPGFAVDAGATYYINGKDIISVSIRDLGAIWNRFNSMDMIQNDRYNYIGFDLISGVRYPEEQGYYNPLVLVREVKDSITRVFQPIAAETKFIYKLAPKTVLHYQHAFSNRHSFGVTNQSAFQKNNFQNILTLSVLQSWSNLSVFENVNLHGVSDVSVGGGVQYEGNNAQFFLATDNVITFYHPANNKTFSVTAGICILLNHSTDSKTEPVDRGIRKRRGKIAKELPYYKNLRPLKN